MTKSEMKKTMPLIGQVILLGFKGLTIQLGYSYNSRDIGEQRLFWKF